MNSGDSEESEAWRLERVLEASLISWHGHNALSSDQNVSAVSAAWAWWHSRDVIISGPLLSPPSRSLPSLSISSPGGEPSQHCIVYQKQTLGVLSRSDLYYFVRAVREMIDPRDGTQGGHWAHTALSSPESLLGPNITFLSDFLSKVAINCVREIKQYSIKFQ